MYTLPKKTEILLKKPRPICFFGDIPIQKNITNIQRPPPSLGKCALPAELKNNARVSPIGFYKPPDLQLELILQPILTIHPGHLGRPRPRLPRRLARQDRRRAPRPAVIATVSAPSEGC